MLICRRQSGGGRLKADPGTAAGSKLFGSVLAAPHLPPGLVQQKDECRSLTWFKSGLQKSPIGAGGLRKLSI